MNRLYDLQRKAPDDKILPMRLFIAICLSDQLKKSVTSTLHELKKAGVTGSYVPTANLHLTLAFIGERKNADEIKEALAGVKFKPFRLSFSGWGNFGDLLYIDVKGNQGLSAAVKSVREALDAAGIRYDAKKFTPHITLIRKLSGSWKTVRPPKGDMTADKISVMKSEERNGKRVYTELFSI